MFRAMPHWGWLLIGLVVVLVAAWVASQRLLDRHRQVDPALVVRDPAEQRVDQGALRRIKELARDDDPGL
jgi:hypothetical protein